MMQHWIVDAQGQMMDSWAEGLPGARLVPSGELAVLAKADGVCWCRLRAGQDVGFLLASLPCVGVCPVVILADEPDETLVIQALDLGAAGCCNSRAASEVLQQVALVVGNGGLWVGQNLLRQVVSSAARILQKQPARENSSAWQEKLSEREREVARKVAGGASNKEIAEQLGITERTVKAHLTASFEKLGIRDRLQLSLMVNGLPV
jgi:DNA-binding NarL/FixJ family response regulator